LALRRDSIRTGELSSFAVAKLGAAGPASEIDDRVFAADSADGLGQAKRDSLWLLNPGAIGYCSDPQLAKERAG
jgi:hypothetical protein